MAFNIPTAALQRRGVTDIFVGQADVDYLECDATDRYFQSLTRAQTERFAKIDLACVTPTWWATENGIDPRLKFNRELSRISHLDCSCRPVFRFKFDPSSGWRSRSRGTGGTSKDSEAPTNRPSVPRCSDCRANSCEQDSQGYDGR
jgi:hypothetical protein